MKKWKEYCESISDYYEWISDNISPLDNLAVISYNTSGMNYNKEEFWKYCKNELSYDLSMPDSIYIYMIATEKVKNNSSKVERYKKCWKKVSDSFDIQGFELSLEIKHEYNGNYYYSGIAKTSFNNLENLLKILDVKGNKYMTFISKQDYFQDIGEIRKLILDYVSFDEYENINYSDSFCICNQKHDIACRYGVDSIGAEFALIISKDDMNTYLSNKFISSLK